MIWQQRRQHKKKNVLSLCMRDNVDFADVSRGKQTFYADFVASKAEALNEEVK